MSKFSKEFKLKIVKENIEKYYSSQLLAEKYNISEINVRRWIKLYKFYGICGLEHKYKRYNSIFKQNVLKYMEDNQLSFLETAMRFNIPKDTTVANWYHKYKENGIFDLPENVKMKNNKNNENKEKELLKELEYLRAENAYLKKLHALVQERTNQKKKKKQ